MAQPLGLQPISWHDLGMQPTTLEAERNEQKKWRLRPRYAGKVNFDRFVAREFLSENKQKSLCERDIAAITAVAVRHVPYYRDLFGQLGLAEGAIRNAEDFSRLPILTKSASIENAARMRADPLPPGERKGGPTYTSGTTGEKLEVLHSLKSNQIFGVLRQRGHRWFRYDPKGTQASILREDDLPPGQDGNPIALGQTSRVDGWPFTGVFFQTGPFIGYSRFNTPDAMADWLSDNQPTYVQAPAAVMEHLALAFQNRGIPPSIRGVPSLGQELTPGMRRRVESVFGLSVHENYGLNEIGLVASRCPQGGRFHVHPEVAHVEIVNEDGTPTEPGSVGKLLVSSLLNTAMPLLRYDTDDSAVAVEGPCPCGRTLPTFGAVLGRRSRRQGLPAGTEKTVETVRRIMDTLPAALSGPLRQYQIHQHESGGFELILARSGPLSPELSPYLRESWRLAMAGEKTAFDITEVDHIVQFESPKFQHFTSDFIAADAGLRGN